MKCTGSLKIYLLLVLLHWYKDIIYNQLNVPQIDDPNQIPPADSPLLTENGLLPTSGFIPNEKTSWATWHPYTPQNDLTLVACSNGVNGLITKFGYETISPLYPYVAAYSGARWNSPVCGACMELMFNSRSIFVTVIDMCGPPPFAPDGGVIDAHFDVAYDAFEEVGVRGNG
jgi:hypothetical protein